MMAVPNTPLEVLDVELAHIRGWLGTGAINIFGLPYAGKDTQCTRVATALGGAVIDGGGLLRRNPHMTEDERKIMEAGELLPIDVYLRLVVPVLGNPLHGGKPLVLSSVGRFFGEEGAVMRASKAADHTLRVVVLLEVSDDDVLQHQAEAAANEDRGIRADDDPGKLTRRIDEFHTKTAPVIDFYRQSGKLVAIQGSGTKDEVFYRIVHAIYDFAVTHPRR